MRAKILLFFSFRGGSGKSTISWNLAKQLQATGDKEILFLELNLNKPSIFHANYKKEDPINILSHIIYPAIPVYNDSDCVEKFFTKQKIKVLSFFDHPQIVEYDQVVFEAMQVQDRYKMRTMLQFLRKKFDYIIVDTISAFSFFYLDFITFTDHIFYVNSPSIQTTGISDYSIFLKLLLDRGFPDENYHWLSNNSTDDYHKSAVDKFEKEPFFRIAPFTQSMPKLSSSKSQKAIDTIFAEFSEKVSTLPLKKRADDKHEKKQMLERQKSRMIAYKKDIQIKIVDMIDKRANLSDNELKRQVRVNADKLFGEFPPPVNILAEATELKKDIINEITGLGPLEDLLEDPEIDEIMVNGYEKIYVEKMGKIEKTHKHFTSNEQVKAIIDRILMPIGRQINELMPYVDARLLDGSRVHAIIPPLSLTGPMLTIRKFSKTPYVAGDLVNKFHSFSSSIAEFLKLCVLMKKNILVSGGAGGGKTTLLNVLSEFIPLSERVITIEDSAELRLNREHVGRLEARSINVEGSKAKVSIRDLVVNALRMRPDRIIVGECRGGEALDMLQAMNTGHQGSLTTIHANSPLDTISRLETMVLMAGVDLPLKAIRNQIASAIDIIVQMNRFGDGSRKVQKVSEVGALKNDEVEIQDIFCFEQKWVDRNGRIYGDYNPTGYIPKFLGKIKAQNLDIPLSIFEKSKNSEVEP
ncbi:ATPase, T2SS/T4P/T4SS family [Candidatus Riflebacteria bacterium]